MVWCGFIPQEVGSVLCAEASACFQSISEEDWEIANASVSSALDVLSRGGTHNAAVEAAEAATREVQERLMGGDSAPEVDEFGRNINLMHQAAVRRRADERKTRWSIALRQAKDLDIAGASGNDESENEVGCEDILDFE